MPWCFQSAGSKFEPMEAHRLSALGEPSLVASPNTNYAESNVVVRIWSASMSRPAVGVIALRCVTVTRSSSKGPRIRRASSLPRRDRAWLDRLDVNPGVVLDVVLGQRDNGPIVTV